MKSCRSSIFSSAQTGDAQDLRFCKPVSNIYLCLCRFGHLVPVVMLDIRGSQAVATLSTTTCHWKNLHRWEVSRLSAEAMAHIVTLPSLTDLCLTDDQSASIDIPPNFPTGTFVSLRGLSVSAATILFFYSPHHVDATRLALGIAHMICNPPSRP